MKTFIVEKKNVHHWKTSQNYTDTSKTSIGAHVPLALAIDWDQLYGLVSERLWRACNVTHSGGTPFNFLQIVSRKAIFRDSPLCVTSSEWRALFQVENLALSSSQCKILTIHWKNKYLHREITTLRGVFKRHESEIKIIRKIKLLKIKMSGVFVQIMHKLPPSFPT